MIMVKNWNCISKFKIQKDSIIYYDENSFEIKIVLALLFKNMIKIW